jgi:fructose-1,6-bisphosphatase/inositol monophosphatase family enzyme
MAAARGGYGSRPAARATGRIRLVGDCVQYALLCRGILDAAVDPLMKPWDIGALAICVREAGGSVSDLNGEQRALVQCRSLVAASCPALRRSICRAVSPPAA